MDPLRNIPRLSELSSHLLRLSTSDRGSFSGLTSVSGIQEWTRAKADEYRQFALALLSIHNLAAPIHSLPTEVLERIFTQCWDDRKSLRLSHICHLWRSIILGRAAFWADAVTNCGPLFDKREVMYDELPFVDALLSRSARHSHGIKLFFHGFTPNIIKSLTPYISNVVSLRVTLNRRSDLYDGLWPVLRSGVTKLDALDIDFIFTLEEMWDDSFDDSDLERSHDGNRGPLTILSHENLPQLSRLTCPPRMVRLFGGVSLRHVKIIGGCDVSQHDRQVLDTPRHHLEPYRDCLETLEIMGDVRWDAAQPAGTEALQLSSLRDLRIRSCDQEVICATLSWLALAQTARVHITDSNNLWHPLFQEFFSPENSMALRSVVAAVDHVCIRCPPSRQWLGDDDIQCFAGDVERLRMENYRITPDGLVTVFGKNASVTRLVLSLQSTSLHVDFRAFPHLGHLEMSGPEIDAMACMLGPTDKLNGRAAKPVPALCPSLAELVITCGFTVRPTAAAPKPKGRAASSRSGSRVDLSATVDKVFCQRWSILQRVLACRASSGSRLTSLALRVRPAMILGQRNDTSKKSAEPTPVWPTPAARQSVLQSLQELVDGPVALKLLDRAGAEIDIDEAEA